VLHPVLMRVPAGSLPADGREKTNALRRHARTALARSASLAGVALGALEKGARGEPLPSGGIFWSLSHTADYVAAVTASFSIGIDVERMAAFTPALKERLARPSEWELAPVDETLFCRFWTAKEAVLKAAGAGLSGLPRCSVTHIVAEDELRLSFDSKVWTVTHHRVDTDHFAAITALPHEVTWHLLELE
jgi:4'-phosphopantetheinyl transferase